MNRHTSTRFLFSFLLMALLGACTSPGRYPPPSDYPAPPPDRTSSDNPPQPWPSDPVPNSHGDERPSEVITREPEPPRKPAGPPPPRNVQEASGPAVVALLGSADQKARDGQPGQAEAYVERAVAVEPRNPFIFQRLAALRLDQGEADQAEAMARKSNSLAGDNPYVKAGNWKLISEARRMRGDSAGAADAASRSESYLSQTRSR